MATISATDRGSFSNSLPLACKKPRTGYQNGVKWYEIDPISDGGSKKSYEDREVLAWRPLAPYPREQKPFKRRWTVQMFSKGYYRGILNQLGRKKSLAEAQFSYNCMTKEPPRTISAIRPHDKILLVSKQTADKLASSLMAIRESEYDRTITYRAVRLGD